MSQVTPAFESFIGVDLHLRTVTLCSVDIEGGVQDRLTCSTKAVDKIHDFIVAQPSPTHLVVEAMGSVEWFVEMFEFIADRTDIADATALALLRGKRRKTDRKDAHDVAQRARRGECPLGYLADRQLREYRQLARHWHTLSKTQTQIKTRMRWILHALNLKGPVQWTGINAGRWLAAHAQALNPFHRLAFGQLLDQLNLLTRQREQLHRELVALNQSPRFKSTVQLFKTIPGIGDLHAAVIVSQVGDFRRFPNADALDYWAGLTPDNKSSAGRTQSGPITKAGNATLRWSLAQAAMTLCCHDAHQKTIRCRLIKRVGRPKANVAMARRLLHVHYAMARDHQPYSSGGPGVAQAA